MVPDADFTSYYGRPVVKASPWTADIPSYLFLGGLAGGSSVLAAGADLTGRPALRRSARFVALLGVVGSLGTLVHDLGRPARFHHMLRVAKRTSPMSVGTWLLTGYGPMAGLAAISEAHRLLPDGMPGRALVPGIGRGAGLVAATVGPAVAAYTSVLLSDTATPAWHDAGQQMPFVFVSSAAAAAGGMGLVLTPTAESAPARRLGVGGALLEVAADRRMKQQMGLSAETLDAGRPGRWRMAGRALTAAGVAGAALGSRSRPLSVVGGLGLVAGSVCTRFGVFEAGQASAKDPRYTVVPQRERLDARRAEQAAAAG